MKANADFALYTPGSDAGRPVSVLASLEAPDPQLLADNATAASLVNSTVSSILGLVGIQADPLTSREHILLAAIILQQWRQQTAGHPGVPDRQAWLRRPLRRSASCPWRASIPRTNGWSWPCS